jgi:hypothetical protein
MSRKEKIHAALKHGAYSATTLLPGEDPAAFDQLHQGLIAEFAATGPLEQDIVANMAHLVWREQNLPIFRIAERARDRYSDIKHEKRLQAGLPRSGLLMFEDVDPADPAAELEATEAADAQARRELGGGYELAKIGRIATVDQLLEDLAVIERLDAMIDKCLKRLLFLRGLKSLAPTQSASPAPAQTSPAPVRRRRTG